ncbi:MAG: hypothetical protein ACRED8_03040 [Caulobacteraceae bacterium]
MVRKQWKGSKKVDDAALDLASKRFHPWRAPGSRPVRPGSLLDLIADDPGRFRYVSIVFVETPTTHAERKAARARFKAKDRNGAQIIDALHDNGMFIGWKKRDLNHLCSTFIEMWMPEDRLVVYGRKVVRLNHATGDVMSRAYWPWIREVVGGSLPTREQIARTDGPMVRRLLDDHHDKVFNADDLASEINKLSMQARS